LTGLLHQHVDFTCLTYMGRFGLKYVDFTYMNVSTNQSYER